METVTVTEELIQEGSNGPAGWNREQLAIIGVSWPPAHGWRKAALGREITKNDYDRFIALRGATGRQRKNIEGRDVVTEFFIKDVRIKLGEVRIVMMEIEKLIDRYEAQTNMATTP